MNKSEVRLAFWLPVWSLSSHLAVWTQLNDTNGAYQVPNLHYN